MNRSRGVEAHNVQRASNMSATVLVLEDNHDINELFALALEQCGFNVIPAYTLAEACHLCECFQVDGILADFNLPDGKGTDIVERLGDCCPKVRLLVTGYSMKHYPGFDEVFIKPVDYASLCNYFRTHLGTPERVQHAAR